MDFNSTIDLIIKDLDDARNIIDDLKKYPGVPVLQVELAKSKCKSAGEVISLLKEPVENLAATKEDPEKEALEQKTVQHIEIIEDEKITDIPVSADPVVEEKKNEIPPVEITTSPFKEKEDVKDKAKKQAESSIFADRFSHMSNRFNEQLDSRNSKEDVSDILKTKPITNLAKAIGINDKFLFIREIFDGNEKAYNQVITKLEEVNSLSEAREIIMSSSGIDKENKVVEQLLNLVKRKLLPYE